MILAYLGTHRDHEPYAAPTSDSAIAGQEMAVSMHAPGDKSCATGAIPRLNAVSWPYEAVF